MERVAHKTETALGSLEAGGEGKSERAFTELPCLPTERASGHVTFLCTFQVEVWGRVVCGQCGHSHRGLALQSGRSAAARDPTAGFLAGPGLTKMFWFPLVNSLKASMTCSRVLVFLKSRFTEPSSF